MLRIVRHLAAAAGLLTLGLSGAYAPLATSAHQQPAGATGGAAQPVGGGQPIAEPPIALGTFKVTSLNGTTIAAVTYTGQPIAIQITQATTYSEDGAPATLADIQPGALIAVRPIQGQQGGPPGPIYGGAVSASATETAAAISIILTSISGVVTAVDGQSLSLSGFDAIGRTVDLTPATAFERAGRPSSIADIAVGTVLDARGLANPDGSLTARRVTIRVPRLDGTVTALTDQGFTLSGAYGASYTIITTPGTLYTTPNGGSASPALLRIGSRAGAEGLLSPDGKTLTALRVVLFTAQWCGPVDPANPGIGATMPGIVCPPPCLEQPQGASGGTGGTAIACGPIPPPVGTTQTITLQNNNQTLTLKVGQRALLDLSALKNFLWTVKISNPAVLGRVPGVLTPYGIQGLFQALAPGQAVLGATGTPNCPDGTACPALAAVFSVTLVVQ